MSWHRKSVQHASTVHINLLGCDEATFVARQESHDSFDIFGHAHPVDELLVRPLFHLLTAEGAGINLAGMDHVDGDTVLAQLSRRATHQPREGGFRSAILSNVGQGLANGSRSDKNDPAGLLTDEMRTHGRGAVERAVGIDAEGASPFLGADLPEWAARQILPDAGIANEDVDSSERRNRLLDHPLNRGAIGHIDRNRHAARVGVFPPDQGNRALQTVAIEIRHHHGGASPTESGADSKADAACRARDDGNLVRKNHSPLPMPSLRRCWSSHLRTRVDSRPSIYNMYINSVPNTNGVSAADSKRAAAAQADPHA